MTLQWYLSWWNLIFILPLLLALLYVGIYAVSGLTFGEADAGHDLDGHGDLDSDVHVDIDSDVHDLHVADSDAPAHLESDTSADSHADAEHTSDGRIGSHHVLSWLGLGRVPLSIVLMVLMISWGTIGFLINLALWRRTGTGPSVSSISLPAAIIGSLLFTRMITTFVARWLPTSETYVHRRHDLLGCTGEALFPIDNRFGMVTVRDTDGDLFQVPCRVQEGQDSIPKGHRVRLVAYNGKQQVFYVTEQSSAATSPSS